MLWLQLGWTFGLHLTIQLLAIPPANGEVIQFANATEAFLLSNSGRCPDTTVAFSDQRFDYEYIVQSADYPTFVKFSAMCKLVITGIPARSIIRLTVIDFDFLTDCNVYFSVQTEQGQNEIKFAQYLKEGEIIYTIYTDEEPNTNLVMTHKSSTMRSAFSIRLNVISVDVDKQLDVMNIDENTTSASTHVIDRTGFYGLMAFNITNIEDKLFQLINMDFQLNDLKLGSELLISVAYGLAVPMALMDGPHFPYYRVGVPVTVTAQTALKLMIGPQRVSSRRSRRYFVFLYHVISEGCTAPSGEQMYITSIPQNPHYILTNSNISTPENGSELVACHYGNWSHVTFLQAQAIRPQIKVIKEPTNTSLADSCYTAGMLKAGYVRDISMAQLIAVAVTIAVISMLIGFAIGSLYCKTGEAAISRRDSSVWRMDSFTSLKSIPASHQGIKPEDNLRSPYMVTEPAAKQIKWPAEPNYGMSSPVTPAQHPAARQHGETSDERPGPTRSPVDQQSAAFEAGSPQTTAEALYTQKYPLYQPQRSTPMTGDRSPTAPAQPSVGSMDEYQTFYSSTDMSDAH